MLPCLANSLLCAFESLSTAGELTGCAGKHLYLGTP